MLKLLRKKDVKKKIIWAVVVVIIIAFGFGGTIYLLNDINSTSYAGKIFGKKVTFEDFKDAYRNVRIQAIMRYGDNFRNIEQYLNLESETWDRLILLREAKKRKIKVSDKEIVERIERYPFFQRNSQFDPILYKNILRNLFRIKPRQFEESIRDAIKFGKLYEQKTQSITIPENDIFEAYKNQNEKAQISYVFITPEQFKNNVTLNKEMTQKYYEENKIEFLLPASIKVNYLKFEFPEAPVSDEKTPDSAASEKLTKEKDLALESADAIYDELLVNPKLDVIAKKHNLKIETTDFFSMEKPNLSLGWSYENLNQIFQLETNEISDILETPKGYYIVQIKEKKAAYVPEYAEAEKKVQEAVITNEAKNIAKQRTQAYLLSINQEINKTKLKDFPKAAKALGLEIYQTPIFNRGQYLPKIGPAKDFQEAAFQLTENNPISPVVETENGYCILHLDSYIPVTNEDYQKNKSKVAETLLNEKKNKVFSDFLSQLRTDAQLQNNLDQIKTNQK